MTAATGTALKLRVELAKLGARHGTAPVQPRIIPLSAPAEGAQVLEGIAAATTIDVERMRFKPYALALPWMLRRPLPPLLYRHNPDRVAGRVLNLSHGDGGCLRIRAEVTDEDAKCAGGFSVACTVHAYELRDVDDRDKFHALITDATIEEISLTPQPANPQALVLQRYRQLAAVEFFDIAKAGVNKCIEIVELLQKISASQASHAKHHRLEDRSTPTLGPAAGHIYGPIPRRPVRHARPPTQFSALVQRMQEM